MKKIDANTMQDDDGRIWTAEPVKDWPQDGDKYFLADSLGRISNQTYDNHDVDKVVFSQGNAFKHEENAEKIGEYRAAMVTLSKSEGARGFIDDGINNSSYFDFDANELSYICNSYYRSSIPIYWPTISQCKAAVKLVGEDKLAELLRWYHTERYFEEM